LLAEKRQLALRQAWFSLGVCVLTVLAAMGYGHSQMLKAPQPNQIAERDQVRVGVLQIPGGEQYSVEKLREATNNLDPIPDFVCWPECVIGIYDVELQSFTDKSTINQFRRKPFAHYAELLQIDLPVLAEVRPVCRPGYQHGFPDQP
jgi:hypothetical protein